jgi:hypothetical protein
MPGGRSQCAGIPPKSDSLSLLQFIACPISADDTPIHTPHADRSVTGAVTVHETGVLLRRLSEHLGDIFCHPVSTTPSGKNPTTDLTENETILKSLQMSRATPQMWKFAKRLIVYETSGKSSGTKIPAAFHVCQKLRPPLATLMRGTCEGGWDFDRVGLSFPSVKAL